MFTFKKTGEKPFKIKTEYLIAALLAICVIVIAAMAFANNNKTVSATTETERYVELTENKLSKVLSKVEGAGNVSVMITVSSGIRSDIAKEEKTTTENGKTVTTFNPILVSGKPIVLSEIYPEITGVLIVSKGADDIRVKMALLNAATTTLGITCDKIQILNQY